jgi:hypothetical protein
VLRSLILRGVTLELQWLEDRDPLHVRRYRAVLAEIDLPDLLRLSALAAEAEAELFARNPQGSGCYPGRVLGRALCQGAAVHCVNKQNGVNDFDVWSFYAQLDDWRLPARQARLRPVEVRSALR